ncbi:MAG: ABC transporter permease [Rubellimicrobium sp.]|nr:ABC transporter permease [Rubellimicrobium sp.]
MIGSLLAAGLVLTTPVLLAATGGLVNRQAGIVNIGLEGKMLLGALVAVTVSSATGSWVAAITLAALAAALVGWLFALVITRLEANQIIAGLGLNVLLAGAIGFALAWVWGTSGTLRLPGVVTLPRPFAALGDLPLAGPVLAALDPLTILAWALVAALPLLLWRTRAGLWIRATGNAPEVVRSVGLSPARIQEVATAIAGACAGLGGAHLALAAIGLFNEGLTGGRGFIALAAFYFGRDRPWPTAAACLLFGLLDAAQIRVQALGLPPRLIAITPYLMVLVVLVLASRRNPGKPT